MSVQQMRHALLNAYGVEGGKWWNKVKRMSDNQVIAVYHRLLEQDPTRLLSPQAKEVIACHVR